MGKKNSSSSCISLLLPNYVCERERDSRPQKKKKRKESKRNGWMDRCCMNFLFSDSINWNHIRMRYIRKCFHRNEKHTHTHILVYIHISYIQSIVRYQITLLFDIVYVCVYVTCYAFLHVSFQIT